MPAGGRKSPPFGVVCAEPARRARRRQHDRRSRDRRGRSVRPWRSAQAAPPGWVGAALACVWLLAGAGVGAQTPPGTLISNQARVSYIGASGIAATVTSNRVDLVTAVERTRATLALVRVVPAGGRYRAVLGPSVCVTATTLEPVPAPQTALGATLAPDVAHALTASASYHGGEALLVRLEDADQNLDATIREQVEVTFSSPGGDSERIRLSETEAASGVFTGHVPSSAASASPGDCVLQVARHTFFAVEYVDAADPTDRATAQAAVDPVSRVFDALSGRTVDNVRITLVDAVSGQPATPYGDDGTSAFPATVTSGATVHDGSGTEYAFSPGEFRFPVVPAGRYRLRVEPPPGFAAPSQRSEPELQALAGAPFVLGQGSFGGAFDVGPAPIMNLDVPVDPAMGTLYLAKRAEVTSAAIGDFIEYRLTLTHSSGLEPAREVVIEDRLPAGLKLVAGSARLAETGAPIEPVRSADGATLRFELDTLAPDASVEVRYVTAVVPGARGRELVNTAEARASRGRSNPARASVRLVEDLFNGDAFLAGRVALDACADPRLGDATGVAGIRLALEDGRFAVTDEGGRYHFEGLEPGSHVVQLDLDSLPEDLELAACSDDSRFAGQRFSRFVRLAPGALGRADFALRRVPPASGSLAIELEQRADTSADTPRAVYTLTVGTADDIDARAVQAMVMLPSGLSFVPDSARDAEGRVRKARVHDDVVTFDLGDRAGPWREVIAFHAVLAPEAQGELVTRALARFVFDGRRAQTPAAETRARAEPGMTVTRAYSLALNFATLSAALTEADRAELEALLPDWRGIAELRVAVSGHSDSVPISAQSRRLYADNYALSAARAQAVADYLARALALDPARLTVEGVGPDRPIGDNATAEGRRRNRRVELEITGLATTQRRELTSAVTTSGSSVVALTAEPAALPAMTVAAAPDAVRDNGQRVPDYDLIALGAGTEWLWPPPDFSPPIPSTKVVIKHAPDERVELSLNGAPVSALNFDGVEVSAELGVALSRWRGIDLVDGPNRLTARIVHAQTRRVDTELTRALHFAGAPVRGELVPEASALVADGKTRPTVALRFVDRWGRPARVGAAARFSVEPPYRSWWDVERLRENAVLMSADRAAALRVDRDGIARIELEPTLLTGQVALTVRYGNETEQAFRAWLAPAPRDWILVGLAEGTLGYRTLAGHVERAAEAGLDADYYDDGRLAFYAKGQVKGSLLTLAFDSEGERDDPLDALGGTIDPDRYYTLYGDNTEQRFDAASRERLYVKVERDAFMAMVGDYDTGLTVTQLGRYSRSLTGFKSERVGERLSYSAFAAETEQAFVRDELRGNGTSGPYRLTRASLLAGSDKLAIEVRDRFRPEQVQSSRALQRHFDYDIDYRSGTLWFREPVASRDFDFDPMYIVVEYETADDPARSIVAGGRGAVHFGDDSEAGLTLVHEATVGAPGSLAAADLRYRVTDSTELTAELAASNSASLASGDASGRAYRVELTHQTGGRQLEAYLGATDAGFGLGQQPATEPGTRRAGVRLQSELGPAWIVESDLFRHHNLGAGNVRTVLEAQTRYEDTRRTARFGLRRVDEALGAEQRDSTQGFAGGTWRFFDEVLTTRMSLESALSGPSSSLDYPTRTRVGLDVAVTDAVSLFGEHELATGAALDTEMTRIGIKATPMPRARIETSFNEAMTEYGPRSFANLGLTQGFSIGDRWTLDLGLERSETLASPGPATFDERVPLASGSLGEDFSSGFVGLGFRAEHWSFTQRLELRDSATAAQRSLISGFYRERTAGRGFSAELRLLDREVAPGVATFDGQLRLGFAYRPADSRWILFDRVDWRTERRASELDTARSDRLVNNFNAHFAIDARQELTLQHGLKYVRGRFGEVSARGFVDLLGIGFRRQLKPRLDVGLNVRRYHGYALGTTERGFGLDFGVQVAQNFVVSMGYNVTGFDDADFAAAGYAAQGPYVQFRLKVDQASLKSLLRR